MLKLETFLQFLSKTDQDALRSKCCTKVASMTQTSLGLMVLLTGILAFFSGSYGIYTAFAGHDWAVFVAIPLGLVYCTMIIAFDREIVGAQDKRAVLFRLPLAFVIGFIVAVPLELRLLEDSVNKRLNMASQEENKLILDRLRTKEDELDSRRKELQDKVKQYRDEVVRWNAAMEAETVGRQLSGRTGIAGQGPAYREAERNRDAAQVFLMQCTNELTQHQALEDNERERLKADFKIIESLRHGTSWPVIRRWTNSRKAQEPHLLFRGA